jgi:hypothetical protein
MSEKLCALRKKGGTLKETVLWTNPSPTSSFSAQNITLSEALSNFKYFSFVVKNRTSDSLYSSSIMNVDEFKNLSGTLANYTFKYAASVAATNDNDVSFTRRYYYVNDTTIGIANANAINANNTNNQLTIPYQIIGLR